MATRRRREACCNFFFFLLLVLFSVASESHFLSTHHDASALGCFARRRQGWRRQRRRHSLVRTSSRDHYFNCAVSFPDANHRPAVAASTSTLAFTVPTAAKVLLQVSSACLSYFGFVAYCDRPRGALLPDANTLLEIKQSTVPGAGLGLFSKATIPQGTVLGTYPGVVLPLQQHSNTKLRQFPQCEGYTWRFSDNQYVIDPTNAEGVLDEYCIGGNPSQFASTWLFESLLKSSQVAATTLCRINEPPRGKDVNVITEEDLQSRSVRFQVERTIPAGEGLFIDYGLYYDRSMYGGNGTGD